MSTDKTVLITGASRGLGLTFAKHYTKAGWKVIGTARNVDKANELNGFPFKIVPLDTSDEDSIAQMAKELDGVPIDLLSTTPESSSQARTPRPLRKFMRHFEINSVGPFLTTRALHNNLKLAADARGLAIVASVTSILGSIEVNLDGAFGPLKKVYYDNTSYRTARCTATARPKGQDLQVVLQPGYVKTDLNHGGGAIDPETSIAGMTKVLSTVTLEDTSKFYDFQGPELPW
ncbi:NAD(P)-binding domain [Phytophthora cactorum]|nr:NAD(P)-binding domain [Phytophthora cactorum]